VEGHGCNPPKEIWQTFASGGNGYAVTMAQVRIASGCHL
jgi:hypothetical protein